MGLFKRKDSPFWWMNKTVRGLQVSESTKTGDRSAAERIYETWANVERVTIGDPVRHAGDDAGIYFIWATVSKLMKVGSSIHLDQRIAGLSLTIPEPIELVASVKTGSLNVRHVEKVIHARLNEKRVRGEWFRISIEDVPEHVEFLSKRIADSHEIGYVRTVL
jgi:hypothetical protein